MEEPWIDCDCLDLSSKFRIPGKLQQVFQAMVFDSEIRKRDILLELTPRLLLGIMIDLMEFLQVSRIKEARNHLLDFGRNTLRMRWHCKDDDEIELIMAWVLLKVMMELSWFRLVYYREVMMCSVD